MDTSLLTLSCSFCNWSTHLSEAILCSASLVSCQREGCPLMKLTLSLNPSTRDGESSSDDRTENSDSVNSSPELSRSSRLRTTPSLKYVELSPGINRLTIHWPQSDGEI